MSYETNKKKALRGFFLFVSEEMRLSNFGLISVGWHYYTKCGVVYHSRKPIPFVFQKHSYAFQKNYAIGELWVCFCHTV